MRLLPKQLWKEEFRYYSEKSVDGLKSDIQHLFEKSKDWNFSINLTGEFITEYEFKMTPNWQFVDIQNFERKVSYLKGQLFQDELKRTCVTFTVRPNSIFLIFFFLFPVFGILALTNINTNGDTYNIIAGLVFTLGLPVLMLIVGHYTKQALKNRFIKTFNLKPIEYV